MAHHGRCGKALPVLFSKIGARALSATLGVWVGWNLRGFLQEQARSGRGTRGARCVIAVAHPGPHITVEASSNQTGGPAYQSGEIR